jgi:aryl-alcohol dehydrogenase-like predicted oxidoreductase
MRFGHQEHLWRKLQGVHQTGSIPHHDYAYFPALADWVGRGGLDFVQVRYSIASRQAEERVLRAAADQGVGVLVNMPLEKARLHRLVQGRPLPDFAAEFGARTWSQFFLKWVISHPAVTCALPATSDPEHAAENIQALRGPLPDQAMRDRMVRHMEGIPGFSTLEQMPWYPGKRYPGIIARAQSQLRARVSPG